LYIIQILHTNFHLYIISIDNLSFFSVFYTISRTENLMTLHQLFYTLSIPENLTPLHELFYTLSIIENLTTLHELFYTLSLDNYWTWKDLRKEKKKKKKLGSYKTLGWEDSYFGK